VFGLIGIFLGGTLSTTLAFAVDYLNPGFRTPEEVIAYLGTPVLASLP
jgi:capsular polysaccharide biosynthesis protein